MLILKQVLFLAPAAIEADSPNVVTVLVLRMSFIKEETSAYNILPKSFISPFSFSHHLQQVIRNANERYVYKHERI